MKLERQTKLLIVGLGQIGGSYAQALSQRGFTVGAIDVDAASIAFAQQKGWISDGCDHADPAYIARFDLLIFALYPHALLNWLRENQAAIRPGALLTDVTGVKESVVETVQELLRPDLEFIGAHPMAGRETSGVRNANAAVFQGANYIITPTERNSAAAIETCRELGRELGFRDISLLSPAEHDRMIGFLSQLTHCIAVALMLCSDSPELVRYTGDSFRDLTRIAKINDAMWSELFLLNKKNLLAEMALFAENFERLRRSIEQDDTAAMRACMRLASERRTWFDQKKD